MNRSSALSIIFRNDEAGHVSGDEQEDCVEDSDSDDEIQVDYAQLDVAEAIILEEQLMGASPTQHLDSLQLVVEEAGPAQKRKRGRPKKNPVATPSAVLNRLTATNRLVTSNFFSKNKLNKSAKPITN
jgi:hypothetical protein